MTFFVLVLNSILSKPINAAQPLTQKHPLLAWMFERVKAARTTECPTISVWNRMLKVTTGPCFVASRSSWFVEYRRHTGSSDFLWTNFFNSKYSFCDTWKHGLGRMYLVNWIRSKAGNLALMLKCSKIYCPVFQSIELFCISGYLHCPTASSTCFIKICSISNEQICRIPFCYDAAESSGIPKHFVERKNNLVNSVVTIKSSHQAQQTWMHQSIHNHLRCSSWHFKWAQVIPCSTRHSAGMQVSENGCVTLFSCPIHFYQRTWTFPGTSHGMYTALLREAYSRIPQTLLWQFAVYLNAIQKWKRLSNEF